MANFTIRTNHHWYEFKCRAEVPRTILKSQFDWMIPESIRDKPELVNDWCKGVDRPELEDMTGDYWTGFFNHHGYWYHTADFMRMSEQSPLGQWDGASHDSMSTGVLIKLDKDGERYQVATFCS